ncbi:aminotransferase class I/II-fold pyridoxal phosphate-dependent enzyme [Gordonia sp. zg691]|uniref:cysteine-S-conjugate beta-lyase n=1 Tax=Gordonia jinghuaiqii TaxID=2758710 RepID=A0A7D7RAT5_9ACTN|nr:aminotransferase class I/II-fold pyridoxal phosphate-dependent enzyme [Gordonia jinghuaiqii]MBD0862766.1 aminotransferase class I/II-fold pyridoxal phosphate-dependent enzyme [Gordonia jinghuaiqii]MCR5979111.1 aminotransferase class I/II-fold pyridoxal phosphate-dependent enzyme [Gordonia jinghuaiqii]QMT01570.1 aminotransferase class I/II-fold pyridoxal phosphate-dependent enzyme [Gordonia jinghuaiqii]
MSTRPSAPPLDELRRRTSSKWSTHPDDVLPLFIAEMDYQLAPVVADAIIARVRASDVGYAGDSGTVGPAFAGFADRRWGWRVSPDDVTLTTDVSVVIVETLRTAIAPGDGVVLMPPVYPPFFELIPEAGGRVVEVPLLETPAHGSSAWRMDLDGVEGALAEGARAILLCHPHNPLGLVHPAADLARLAELAAAYDATVVSDEIHAPLVHPGAGFTPFLAVSDAAREIGIAAHSASKAFNLAGAKCAFMVAASDRTRAIIARQPDEVRYRASLLGRAATEAAFGHGDEWLDATIEVIGESLDLLEKLLAQHLPGVGYTRPQASYLAWLDFREAGLGDNPGIPILERARVALHYGPAFGKPGAGFARLNVACSPEVLTEAIERIATVVP